MSNQPTDPQNAGAAAEPPPADPASRSGETFSIPKSWVKRVLIAGGIVIAIAIGWHLWSDHEDSESKTNISAMVKDSMQHQLDSDSRFSKYQLRVESVDVLHKSGNQYEGMATVRTAKGTEHQVPIDVTADGDKVLWNTGPGAFAFAIFEDTPIPTPTP
jgi:VCBS repeat-containing protein